MKNKILLSLLLFVCACAPLAVRDEANIPEQRPASFTDKSYLLENVIIKEKSPYFITYKYKNVRVDEVAKLAAIYCSEYNVDAYLKEVILDVENYRLATFNCNVINY